jgi:oxygen-independent coproporphyrinogen-3 oxidase
VTERGHGVERWEPVTTHDQGTEALLMGMRLSEGVELARIERLLAHPIPHARLATLKAQGLIEHAPDRLRATPKGRLVLNAILKELVA